MTDGIGARKPRIALMGEFSAGKSTLTNLLLGARPLPESVTATCLSPVWITQGEIGAEREHLDGSRTPVDLEELQTVPIDGTRAIHLSFDSAFLSDCDLIDCPGISDPNMPSDVWERLVPEFDAVIWCTHATQAWRQSEDAVWENFPEEVRAKSILLVTRFDKITEERDRLRVLARVKRETRGKFAGVFPIALLQALAAGDDAEKWEASGAHAFAEFLTATINQLNGVAHAAAPVETEVPSLGQTEAPAEPVGREDLTSEALAGPMNPSILARAMSRGAGLSRPGRGASASKPEINPVLAAIASDLPSDVGPARPVRPRRVTLTAGIGGERPRRPRPEKKQTEDLGAPAADPSLNDLRNAFSRE